jgi:hypothetical protein
MQDLMNVLSAVAVIAPGAQIKTTTYSAAIDVTALNGGNNGLVFVVDSGVITDGTHTFGLQDQIDGATWNTVAAPFVQTPAAQSSNAFVAATPSGTILKFGYLGNPNVGTDANSTQSGSPANKVLVRLVDTVTGAPATGGYYGAIAILGYPFNEPAA